MFLAIDADGFLLDFNNGFIIQFGYIQGKGGNTTATNQYFPTAFPNKCTSCHINRKTGSNSDYTNTTSASIQQLCISIAFVNITNTYFCNCIRYSIWWTAFGF